QDVVGLVIGKVTFEEGEVVIDVGDEPCVARDEEHGTDSAGGKSLDTIGEFVVDFARGDHGSFALRPGTILDAAGDSPLALPQLAEDSSFHWKASVAWNNEDVFLPLLFQERRGFSSFFSKLDLQALYFTLGSGLIHARLGHRMDRVGDVDRAGCVEKAGLTL